VADAADVLHWPRLYATLGAAQFRSIWQFRTASALLGVAALVSCGLDFATIVLILRALPRLAGFDLADMAVLYGCSNLSLRLADTLVGQIEKIGDKVRDGTLDRTLLRPAPPLLQLAAEGCRPQEIGKLLQAVGVLVAGLVGAGVDWTPERAALLALTLVGGTGIFVAVWILGAAVTSLVVGSKEAMNAFTYGGGFVTEYPLDIYGQWFRRLFLFVIPLGFVCWFPVVAILGKRDPIGAPAFARWLSPLVAAAALTIAGLAWRGAMRRYRSTGS
jgi:ABC-2 type transport system permease protein